MGMRQEVLELVKLGSFPFSDAVEFTLIEKQEELLRKIEPPVSDDEARALVKVFGPDDYYGLVWTVLHLVESAPHWPLEDCLQGGGNEWIQTLRHRVENAKG